MARLDDGQGGGLDAVHGGIWHDGPVSSHAALVKLAPPDWAWDVRTQQAVKPGSLPPDCLGVAVVVAERSSRRTVRLFDVFAAFELRLGKYFPRE